MPKYGRFNIETKPSGLAPADDDPYSCGGCDRRIMPGQPYWGGGVDYWSEADSVYCARCQAGSERAVERECRHYERNGFK